MRKTKLTHQYSFAYALAFVSILLVLNYVFFQSQQKSHYDKQQKLCQFIITSFSSSLVYGLSYGSKAELNQTLFPLRNNPDIAFVRVVDNQGTVISEVDNRVLIGINQKKELETIDSDIMQSLGTSQASSLPSQLFENEGSGNRRLGKIQIATTPYEFSKTYTGISYILLNAGVIVPLALFWFYLRFRQTHQVRVIKKLIDLLNDSESYKEFRENLKTSEGSDLLNAVEQQVIKTQNLRHKLNLLKSEVQQARLDANTELHEFIGFITQQNFNSSINNLMLFYEIIKQPVNKASDAVWCRDLLAQTIVELSSLAKEKETLIQDSFSGNRMSYQVQIDDKAFKQMLKLLLQQLIAICSGQTLNIHFDLRQDYQDTASLRISFSSESELFLDAIEKQSLFQFKEDLPVTTQSNNIQLISAKHLLKKFGGEYVYLSDEIRLEIPLATLNPTSKKSQPEPITPLGIELNVLVYDSDPIDKMVLIGYLTKLGIDVDKATTKQVVLQKLRHDDYDAIMVDSDFIADDNAFSFSNFLEELEHIENKPRIIIISHDSSVTESDAFMRLESAQHISKPVDPKKLGEILTTL